MKLTSTALIVLSLASAGVMAKGVSHSGSHATSSRSTGSSHSVSGYTKKDGTTVAPTRATNPNKSTKDNYSHVGNVNPHNGKVGKKTD